MVGAKEKVGRAMEQWFYFVFTGYFHTAGEYKPAMVCGTGAL
jgi:hypothetical protein